MVVGIGVRIAKKAFKMTAKRKKALAAAQKASALARKGKGKAVVGKAIAKKTVTKKAATKVATKTTTKVAKKTTAKVSRKTAKIAKRKAAIDKVESMGFERVSRGTKLGGQRRVSTANFKGKEGRALKRASYKSRLASSRAKYKQSSLKNRAGQKAIGLFTPSGLWRRKYVDLTTGENVRRNFTRGLKVGATLAAGQAAILQASGLGISKQFSTARDVRRYMKGN